MSGKSSLRVIDITGLRPKRGGTIIGAARTRNQVLASSLQGNRPVAVVGPTRCGGPPSRQDKHETRDMNQQTASVIAAADITPLARARRQPFGVADLFKARHRTFVLAHGGADEGGPRCSARTLVETGREVARILVISHGSLAWTGKGHATDRAIVLGLAGEWPETIDPDRAKAKAERINVEKRLNLRETISTSISTRRPTSCSTSASRWGATPTR